MVSHHKSEITAQANKTNQADVSMNVNSGALRRNRNRLNNDEKEEHKKRQEETIISATISQMLFPLHTQGVLLLQKQVV